VITTSFAAASFLVSMMELIRARRDFEPESRPPDRARPSRPRR